jgi:hypothetical protein
VCYRSCAFLLCNLDCLGCDQRARKRSRKRVLALVGPFALMLGET